MVWVLCCLQCLLRGTVWRGVRVFGGLWGRRCAASKGRPEGSSVALGGGGGRWLGRGVGASMRGGGQSGRCGAAGTKSPPVRHSVWLLLLYGALDSHPFFPSHVASGCCFLSDAAAGALAGVVSAFAEHSSWCVGAVLNVAWCAVCVSAAPNNWRID